MNFLYLNQGKATPAGVAASGPKGRVRGEPVCNGGTAVTALVRDGGYPHTSVDSAVVHGRTRNRLAARVRGWVWPVVGCIGFACVGLAQATEPDATDVVALDEPSSPVAASVPSIYHFDWRTIGAAAIAPYQVFDDGTHIYLQFPNDIKLPAIFTESLSGTQLMTPRRAEPYWVIDSPASVLVFRLGHLVAKALPPRGKAPARMITGEARPVQVTGSVPVNPPTPPIVRPPIAATAAAPTTNVPAAAPSIPGSDSRTWLLTLADHDVGTALAGWAKRAGATLTWDSPIVAPITAPSSVTGSFDDALAAVVQALHDGGYPLALTRIGTPNGKPTYRIHSTDSSSTVAEK